MHLAHALREQAIAAHREEDARLAHQHDQHDRRDAGDGTGRHQARRPVLADQRQRVGDRGIEELDRLGRIRHCHPGQGAFKRAAMAKGITLDQASLDHVLDKYAVEGRLMKSCEPRDLLNRVNDLCLFEGRPQQLTPELLDVAWRNYFGAAHTFERQSSEVTPANQSRSVSV